MARGPIKAMRRGLRRGTYRFVHAVLPERARVRMRRLVRGAERDQRRAEERTARQREKELRVELKEKAQAARAAKSRSRKA